MSRVQCFWLAPTDQVEMDLRRFVWSSSESKCPEPLGYHNENVTIGRCAEKDVPYRGRDGAVVCGDVAPHEDPRWPKACSCGYAFKDGDQWQFNAHQLYRRSDNAELVTLANAPAGAMWDAHWCSDSFRGPDGLVLCVRTPGGEWLVDGPAYSNGQQTSARGWSRSGTPPAVTANPSILIPGRYHGFLRDGWLEEC